MCFVREISKIKIMLVNLSVLLLLTTICCAIQPSIVTRIDSNEISFEHHLQQNEQFIFPTIDPNIAEDAKLTTVLS